MHRILVAILALLSLTSGARSVSPPGLTADVHATVEYLPAEPPLRLDSGGRANPKSPRERDRRSRPTVPTAI